MFTIFIIIVVITVVINSIVKALEKQKKIKFILTSENASIPEKGTQFSAGFDLSSSEECVIPARSRKAVKTNVKVELPENTYGRIASRSGLSFRCGIEVGAGVIDEDYRNELMVILHNHSDEEFMVKKNDRIAQLIVESIVHPITYVQDLTGETQIYNKCIRQLRGLGGFGSTGIN
jgi:dUTP pyrophosphatase